MSEIDFAALNEAALSRCPSLLEDLLPGGRARGREYVCGSLQGGQGESCSVNMDTGRWCDFATDEKGGDLISLAAAIYKEKQSGAAIRIAGMFGYPLPEDCKTKSQKQGKPEPIQPIPQNIRIPWPDQIRHWRNGEPDAVFRYCDQHGRVLGFTCRFNKRERTATGKLKKEFAPYVYNPAYKGGWDFVDFRKPYPLYNLQNLAKTPTDAPVVVLEGEAKADALQRILGPNTAVLGLYGGSSRADKADCAPLADRRVIYWPDNDAPGSKAAIAFARAAIKVAASVFVVMPPENKAEGWDCGDAAADGWGKEDFTGWITGHRCDLAEFERLAARRWGVGAKAARVEEAEPAPEQPLRLVCVNALEFVQMNFPEREMLIDPILPKQGLAMLHAMRGVGKTFLGLCLAYAAASGGDVFGRWKAGHTSKVLYIDGEMPARVLQDRLIAIARANPVDLVAPENLSFLTPDLQPVAMPNLATPEGQEAVEGFVADADIVILDNLTTLCRHGRANDEESWQPVQGWLLNLRKRGKSALVIHHQNKGGDQRGTGAKEDILDTVISLRRPSDYEMEQGARFEVRLTKARGICGEAAKPFEASLDTSNGFTWRVRDIEESKKDRMKELLAEGVRASDIAEELGVGRATVYRWMKQEGITAK